MLRETKWELFCILAVMFGMPLAAKKLVPADEGMAAVLLLFFVINPTVSVFMGIRAGRNIKKRWHLPLVTALGFLIFAWLLFSAQEMGFVLYAGIYLVLGYVIMLSTAMLCRK
ncbi:MAG: hypothetical protein E7408_00245 [Ruminococcaceae bacterium]|nr:hypothetical protein [Oscillospiraceae bacterium]